MVRVYYNENDPKAAAWLRMLISQGHLPQGDVDERSIEDVRPDDLRRYRSCHFFAGIGGWPLAFRLAGWPDDRPVWSGSCPCQPLSSAGKRKGHVDERHLWPAFFNLIAERRPAVIFGEQVASKIGYEWLAGVRADMESVRYAVGAADLCAAGAGAPHIRQRLFWVADAGHEQEGRCPGPNEAQSGRSLGDVAGRCDTGRMEHTAGSGLQGKSLGLLGTSDQGYWDNFDILPCTDGKARRVEPGSFPLAHGVPARVVRLRGYGNAIVPQVAAEFIQAYDEATGSIR